MAIGLIERQSLLENRLQQLLSHTGPHFLFGPAQLRRYVFAVDVVVGSSDRWLALE